MTMRHGAVGNRHVFARRAFVRIFRLNTRFDRDAVVADTDVAVGNAPCGESGLIPSVLGESAGLMIDAVNGRSHSAPG
jgi:hypothetical protein